MPSRHQHLNGHGHGHGHEHGHQCAVHPHNNLNQSKNYLHQIEVTPTRRRGPIAAEFSSPGPAIVLLPSTFGPNRTDARKSISPAYSFGGRYEEKKENKTPGPAEYDVEGLTRIGRDWSPAVFLSPKLKEPEPFRTPSPTQYSPEKSVYYSKGKQAPSYTFGYKAKEHIPDLTPSPAEYKTENVWINKNQSPNVSFGSKFSPYAHSF